MRWLTLAIACVLTISGCTPSTPAPAGAAPAAKPSQAATASDHPASPTVDGIRLVVDGQTVDVPGEVQVSRQAGTGGSVLYVGKNPRPSALVGGNGVLLELQVPSGKDGSSASDVGAVTFTVWKGVEFWYISTGAMPGQPVRNLILSQASGRLVGSFEADLSGTPGKIRARIDFGVPLPR